MKIIADSQIPFVKEAFSCFGNVSLHEGRSITPELVTDADILLVRSVTNVNQELLENSKVKFVATATSGIDHVDTGYLCKSGIHFASAHGSNAQSVVEYVLSCLFVSAEQGEFDPFAKTVGIIGCGKIGSALKKSLDSIGISNIVHDPPLKDVTADSLYRELPEILETDVISLHVPLTDNGKYPTRELVDDNFLTRLKDDVILINTSRGDVIQENALKKYVKSNNSCSVILDVWRNEPQIDLELVRKVTLGTPHIAGYGLDARIKATELIYTAACNFFKTGMQWKPSGKIMNTGMKEIRVNEDANEKGAIPLAVLSHYDVRSDAVSLRSIPEDDGEKTGHYFDELRKNYPLRRNFSATTIRLHAGSHNLAQTLERIGFTISRD